MQCDLRLLAREAGLEPASILVTDLRDGAILGAVDPERDFYPASMIKTPLVAAVLAQVDAGILTLDQRFDVTEANATHNDAPSPLVPGYTARLDELCELAIARSDNVATNVLFDAVGREQATRIARDRWGLRDTAFYRKLSGSDPLIDDPLWDRTHLNTHPASDAAALFRMIALDLVPYAGLLRDWLAGQYWNDKLSRGLRDGDLFMHKTGDTGDVSHDGGIMVTAENRAFVVVVYTGLPSTDETSARFAPFMSELRAVLA